MRTVLLIGDADHEEMREAGDWLHHHASLQTAASMDEALAMLESMERDSRPSPSLLVLAQPRRGCFSHAHIDRLRRALPLAPILGLLGSWCEGEIRSGRPWAGVERVYWHQWQSRLGPLLEPDRRFSPPSLPRTSTPVEAALAEAIRPIPQGNGLVLIHADSWSTFDPLADACQLGGYGAAWQVPGHPVVARGVAAVLWDGAGCDPHEAETIRALVAQTGHVPLICLMTYPRQADRQAAFSAGAVSVIGKPFSIHDLLYQLAVHAKTGTWSEAPPRLRAG